MKKTIKLLVKTLLASRDDYNKDNDKEISRFRITRSSIKKAADLNQLPDNFEKKLFFEMTKYGWLGFLDFDDNFVFVKNESLKNWARLGSTRINKQKEELEKND